MTNDVDPKQADKRARELADDAVRHSFGPDERETLRAERIWRIEYRRQYYGFTRATPPAEKD